jgi:galactokinase/mevalonate kinase-like predicted kinase
MKTIITTLALMLISAGVSATELVHQFNSPAFSGVGYSSHVLTIEQLEATRRQKLREEEASRLAKAELAAKQTNIAKFLVNVESRIYAQLSKQLADSLFSGGGTC